QPEAFIPHSNTYIEKDSKINEEIDRLRHAATQALMARNDIIIVASVSCIYNLGSPEDYRSMGLEVFENKKISPSEFIRHLTRLQYIQDIELKRGCFRKTHDEIEVVNPNGIDVVRVKFKNDKIINIGVANAKDPEELEMASLKFHKILETIIFPAKYWITSDQNIALAIENIKSELQKRVQQLKREKKYEEAARLQDKTTHDIEMLRQTGYCHGIENYSMHLDFRKPGDPPYTLLDFFKSKGKFLTIIDESHISVPQLRSMYNGDFSRKSTLVNYGFRLPSAIDNRPLRFPEFQKLIQKTVYVSATPSKYEIAKAGKENIAEQLVRPTGLLDPTIEIQPSENQIAHLLEQIKQRTASKERVIVTTLTKRMAEDLTEHLAENGIKVNYLHSEIKTLDRLTILKDFRMGIYDVVVGVNLLREGLDLPEVSLIAILDADKEGFLRNTTTLIQTMGRAARNVNGHVILYADKNTKSIESAVQETLRRRRKQEEHNKKHGITPTTIIKHISSFDLPVAHKAPDKNERENGIVDIYSNRGRRNAISQLTKAMEKAIRKMDYEEAMVIREQIQRLKHNEY
ncbi:MAG: helicase-related protein, partial [Candidatus Yanofskybacteria bacterium]|nr:helicase-related protein [Candidatus Yanofskybacteria bacterium]